MMIHDQCEYRACMQIMSAICNKGNKTAGSYSFVYICFFFFLSFHPSAHSMDT